MTHQSNGKEVSLIFADEDPTRGAVTSESSSDGKLEKKSLHKTTFPDGFEAWVSDICDETEVAELKLKVGDFEMHLRRNIGNTKAPAPSPIVSPSTPPPVPTKPMVESAPATAPSVTQKAPPVASSPFSNVSAKASKLASLDSDGANAYVIVASPTVGKFRTGRTVKGKRQPPVAKEGDVIKEDQIIGYLDQFGSELPVKSDVAGEVLKILFRDGEAVGYGDPLIAVLPSFHGIK
ncbi:hypothetical protein AMTR_s00023p00073640 [Amborella trichopoda]|uniref:Lipoyl-binding domain-containing protein n=1 Tax=Amborella trichopoda TaxID=13333 RepID=W1NK46_AMBTC|nr:hypothetical protein AMTR_s00023p00073640 [Amborella trichopoda]